MFNGTMQVNKQKAVKQGNKSEHERRAKIEVLKNKSTYPSEKEALV